MACPQNLFRCQYPGCGSSYRRKEHLTRHAKGHNQTKSYSCPHCDRVFSRNDILRQHIRRNHDGKQIQSERTIKACNQCRRRRSKCTGNNPCDRCVLQGLKCSFSQPEAESTSSVSLTRSESLEQSFSRAAPLIEAYFDKFHPEWPFLHRATFDPEHEPQSLLQSVIMMGMLMMDPDDVHCHALNIHSKLAALINEQCDKWDISSNPCHISRGQEDSRPAPWPIATYQGILLQIIFSLLHPSDRSVSLRLFHILPETISRLLVSLVQTCLRQTMFFYPSILTQFEPGSNPDVFVWLGIEEIKRFALCLYKTCQSCHLKGAGETQGGRRKGYSTTESLPGSDLLNLEDLQFALPENDDLWHVDSDLATKLAERSVSFSSECDGENWISRAAALLQPGNRSFRWL